MFFGNRRLLVSYTFFAIGCYIIMRGVQVLLEDQKTKSWYKILMTVIALLVIYAGISSVIVWYKELPLLGFSPSK
jgi:hypothetical protein